MLRYMPFLIGLLFPLSMLCPANVRADIVDEVAVVVNDDVILRSELIELIEPYKQAYLAKSGRRRLDDAFLAQARMLVEDAIATKFLLQEARKYSIEIEETRIDEAMKKVQARFGSEEEFRNALADKGETVATWREKKMETLLAEKLTALKLRELRQEMTISEQEVRNYYEEHREEFGAEPKVTLIKIFVAADKSMSPTERSGKRAMLEEALTEIRGGVEFERVAERLSEDDGSTPVEVARGDLPAEVERAVFSMQEGDVSDIVESERGFYIAKVVRAASQEPPQISDVRAEIESKLRAGRVREKFDDWLKKLRENAQVQQYFRWNDILNQ